MPIEKSHDRVILHHPKGASTEILFFGATIISWKAVDRKGSTASERLFVSSKAVLDGSKAVRGGIPVVFPCFGAPEHPEHAKLSQHGFARNEIWSFDKVVMDNEAGVSVKLTLNPGPSITALYSKSFQLAYVVTLAEHQLSTDLHVLNPSNDESLEFQALLHTYIRAPANDVSIAPLLGKSYIDKTEKTLDGKPALKQETRSGVDVRTFTDSVYEDAPQKVEVTWPEGGLETRLAGFINVVVWNPQAEAGSKMGDMEEGGWERFVCVEPGYVRGFKKLEPGESWTGQQVLSLL
ncbi:galactose mutarotase-like protein [Artomyces pyxidatus]|uniref:Galactose mutarotase-like protein n=1 Tax=Artomyces pyxidatus TaxID=48021 RepID=A0ACB8TIC5_9AGAM|nr:galactose mutarotase-like protein [Artomyces pyxidatus]